MLLVVLIMGLRLGGVSLGLLSGWILGLLTFWIQPVAPPNDLILLHATWLLLMATLETAGLFYLMENRCKALVAQTPNQYGVLVALFCYGCVFLTGDKAWVHRLVCNQNALHRGKVRLLVLARMAAHMALLASPLSIAGILLIVVAGNSRLSIVYLVGMIGAITVGLTVASSLLVYLIPDRWLNKLSACFNDYSKDEVVDGSKNKVQLTFLLLLLAEVLFVLLQPVANRFTRLSCVEKIFPVRFPIFFALAMLSMAAVVMLWYKLKPVKIIQSHRFELGIQQFFIFLGLTWLIDSLINYDKAYVINMLCEHNVDCGFYLVAVLYILLIDIPIIIWLFGPLLIACHCTIPTLALWLVVVHSLAPIRSWISSMVQACKKNSSL